MTMTRRSFVLLAMAAIIALAAVLIPATDPVEAQSSGSPVSTFIRFDDIPGEALEVNHEGWSVAESINTSLLRTTTAGTTRSRARSQFEDVIVVKPVDSAGPYLQLAAWTGKVLDRVDIEIVRNGGDARTSMWEIELENVVVTSYNLGTTGQSELTPNDLPLVATSMAPTEQVTLSFEKAKVRYIEQNDDGSAGDEHEVEFDVVAGA
jgi:type VI secretion system secreted protein Hcp